MTSLEDIRRDPGWDTENVTPLTDEDRAALVSMGLGLLPPHQHDGYGWRGCALCRRVEAQRVSRVFPDAWTATADANGRVAL